MTVQISIDKADLARLKATMFAIGKSADPVMSRAINKTLGNVQTFAVGKISENLNLTKTRIRKDFVQYKSSPLRVQGSIVAKGKPVGLMSFSGTKELKSGAVSVKIWKDKKPEHLDHAFIAMATGNKHVFERVYSLKHRAGPYHKDRNYAALPNAYRYPVARLDGPRVEDVYAQDARLKPTLKHAGERLSVNIRSQLDYEWSKLP